MSVIVTLYRSLQPKVFCYVNWLPFLRVISNVKYIGKGAKLAKQIAWCGDFLCYARFSQYNA